MNLADIEMNGVAADGLRMKFVNRNGLPAVDEYQESDIP